MSDALRLRAILNPSAGSGRARKLARAWAAAPARLAVEWEESRSADHLQEVVRAAQAEPLDALVLAGGDGTVTLAANASSGALEEPNRVPLAVVPAGSGNDFARELGAARGLPPWSLLERGAPARVDLGELRALEGDAPARRFCCVASVGFDARALELIHGATLPRSRLLNVYASLRALWSVPPARVRVTWEGGGFEGPAMLVGVTNTRGYGGGFLLSPGARIDDGRLDVCVIGDVGRGELIRQFPRIFAGTHGGHPGVVLASSPWVRLESLGAPLPVCLDGERAGAERTPVELRCVPGALAAFAVPRPAPSEVAPVVAIAGGSPR